MKKITTFLGCVGVVCFLWGCSSTDSGTSSNDEVDSKGSSSSSSTDKKDSTKTDTSKDKDSKGNPDSASSHDTVTVHQQIIISTSSEYKDPYFSSGVFCWSEECEKKWASVSSASRSSSSSAASIEITMSSEVQVPPTIDGNKLTDNRDKNKYEIIEIGSVLWMTSNLKFKPSKGFYCNDGDTDVCATYGVFYTNAAAQNACPSEWRLPTQAEAEAANEAQGHDWWTIGGRFKINSSDNIEYGLADEQGYLWLASGENNAWRVEHYSEKKIEEATKATDRAFNVRCVKNK